MPIREMVTCSRCGKTEPVTLRTRMSVRRLLYEAYGFTVFDRITKHIDLCESCWKDFERFLYDYEGDKDE